MKSLAIIYSAKNKPLKLDEIEISDPGPEQESFKCIWSNFRWNKGHN